MKVDPNYKENKLLALIRKGINARYSVPAWLWVILSFVIGFLIALLAFTSPATSPAFFAALPLSGKLLGPLTALSALVAMYGMGAGKPTVVKWAAMASFLFWLFISFALFIDGGAISVAVIGAPILVFWGYKYLASWVREVDGI
jgi:hypothetical protein